MIVFSSIEFDQSLLVEYELWLFFEFMIYGWMVTTPIFRDKDENFCTLYA